MIGNDSREIKPANTPESTTDFLRDICRILNESQEIMKANHEASLTHYKNLEKNLSEMKAEVQEMKVEITQIKNDQKEAKAVLQGISKVLNRTVDISTLKNAPYWEQYKNASGNSIRTSYGLRK